MKAWICCVLTVFSTTMTVSCRVLSFDGLKAVPFVSRMYKSSSYGSRAAMVSKQAWGNLSGFQRLKVPRRHILSIYAKRSSSSKSKGDWKGNKQNLPQKDCVVCGRPFTWRKKWARCWEEVKYCSDKCRREGKR
mmetsp:Transcript_1441/g.2048  ORF Transcript_1441/g.2048 Transcript_1441/m.2048 type:complete len:134 (+) Transcript_1441:27-428(+)